MQHRSLAFLTVALATGAAFAVPQRTGAPAGAAQSPFVDLTYEQALERACAEGRVLMLDFTRGDPRLREHRQRTIWSDPRVIDWIESEAVALELDLERDLERAARLAVRWPTTVFLDGEGREFGRSAAFADAAGFLQEARFHSSREPVERAAPVFSGDPDDPMDRGQHADALRAAGFLEEALVEYLWCWDEGVARSRAYAGVHGSFLVGGLRKLAQVLPQTREAMESRRAELSERVLRPGATQMDSVQVAMDIVALDQRFFEEPARSVADYEAVLACGDELADARRALAVQIQEPLLEARRYDLLLAGNPDPLEGFERLAKRLERRGARRDLRPEEIENAVSLAALWFEACAGVGRREDALALADGVLRIDGGPLTWAELIRRCARAEAHELGRELLDRARIALTAEQLPAVEAAATYLR
jgi:tetratricopeptide (TPR) repeat protein